MYCATLSDLKLELNKLNSGLAIVLAAEKDFDFDIIQPMIQSAKVEVVGAFFPGVIAESKLYYTGYLLIHVSKKYDCIVLDHKKKINGSLKERKIKKGIGLLLVDGLAAGMQSFLDDLHFELGGKFRFVGSGAGSLSLKQTPCVFDKDGLYQDKALVVLIDLEVAIGIKHGYDRIAGPLIATAVKDNVLGELNWEVAFQKYSEIVNNYHDIPITKEDFFNVSKVYPLGLNRKGQEDIVRDPISVEPNGIINCIDDIPENAALYVLKGEPEKLIEAARDSGQQAVDASKGKPQFVLIVDCVTRVLFLEDEFSKEIDMVTKTINSKYNDMPIEGLLSMGEISTYGDGRLELYNKTIVSMIFHD